MIVILKNPVHNRVGYSLLRPAAMDDQEQHPVAVDDMEAKPKLVFLSHSSSDRGLAEELCTALEAQQVSCWIAPRDVVLGQPYALACLDGVIRSQSLLLLASDSALRSVQVLSEVEQAHKRSKPIYTVLIPPAKVRGEMDFYISRLHWLESGGRTAAEIAEKLGPVLLEKSNWKEVSSPPTLQRTRQYRPVAFVQLLAAAALAILLILGAGGLALNRFLDKDFRRLGYTDVAAETTENEGAILVHMRVWIMQDGIPFRDIRVAIASETADGTTQQEEYKSWAVPDQIGSSQSVTFPLTGNVRRLATCLILPSRGLGENYRVTQLYTLVHDGEGLRVAEISEKRVSKEDGSACGSNPKQRVGG